MVIHSVNLSRLACGCSTLHSSDVWGCAPTALWLIQDEGGGVGQPLMMMGNACSLCESEEFQTFATATVSICAY